MECFLVYKDSGGVLIPGDNKNKTQNTKHKTQNTKLYLHDVSVIIFLCVWSNNF